MKQSLPCLIGFLFFIQVSCWAQGPVLNWAKGMGGSGFSLGFVIANDPAGNVYTAGLFEETVDFDPGPANYPLTSTATATNARNIFITKLDAAGNFIWAKSFPNTDYEFVSSIVVDAQGNSYVSGSFNGTVDFDPGSGTHNMISDGVSDLFILKLNTNGNFVWAKQIGGPEGDNQIFLTLGKTGLYLTGDFVNTVDFDPGPAVYNLTSAGSVDIYVAKLDTAANFLWAHAIGGSAQDIGLSIAIDTSENILVTGVFLGTTDFDPGPAVYELTSNGPWSDIFILKLDSSFNFIWAGSIGCAHNDLGANMAIDVSGNIYLTGTTNEETDFNPGPGVYNLSPAPGNNNYDIYICKINASGSFAWAQLIGATGVDWGQRLAVDDSANVYTTGYFTGTVDFDSGPGVYNLPGGQYAHSFICKMNSSGNLIWANDFGYPGGGIGYDICINGQNLYATGQFSQTVDFDPGPGTYNLTATAGSAIYVIKLSPPTVAPLTLLDFSVKAVSDHVVQLQWQTAQEQNTDKFIIERSADSKQFSSIGTVIAATNSSTLKNYVFTDKDPLLGNDFYRLQMMDNDGMFTYSKVEVVNMGKLKSLQLYPNPARDILYVKTCGENETATLQITDAAGKVVRKQTLKLDGNLSFPINIQTLSQGKYNVILYTNSGKVVMAFFKL